MIKEALFHKADSNYCFSPALGRLTLRFRTANCDKLSISVIYNGKYDFHLVQKKIAMEQMMVDEFFAYYAVTVKSADPRFVYIFEISEKNNKCYYSEEGFTDTYNFADSHFTAFQLPYINEADAHDSVEWLNNATFYQVFVDRFYKAEGTDKDTSYINLKWGDIPNPKSFAGGDLKGVTMKLGHIRSLGATALYITPIFTAPSNHKYDTWDYFAVDPMFGTKEDLKALVLRAHDMDMRIVLDAVFNHCGEGFAPWQDVIKNGEKSSYYNWFYMNGKDYEHFASCKYMPKLNTENPECAEYLLDVAEYWIKEFDIDGWRLDVSDEVPHAFWREFRKRVKRVKPDCAIIGENWHDAEPFLRGDQFDSVMNYAYTKAAIDYFAKSSLDEKGLSDRLNAMLSRNNDIVNNMLFNLIDNHDTHRFINIAKGSIKSLQGALALGYMLPGSFCVYYGTENEMAGGYDPDCRRCFDWNHPESKTFILIQRLSELKKNDVMKFGTVKIYCEDGVFILEREYCGKKICFTLKGFDWEIIE